MDKQIRTLVDMDPKCALFPWNWQLRQRHVGAPLPDALGARYLLLFAVRTVYNGSS